MSNNLKFYEILASSSTFGSAALLVYEWVYFVLILPHYDCQ